MIQVGIFESSDFGVTQNWHHNFFLIALSQNHINVMYIIFGWFKTTQTSEFIIIGKKWAYRSREFMKRPISETTFYMMM